MLVKFVESPADNTESLILHPDEVGGRRILTVGGPALVISGKEYAMCVAGGRVIEILEEDEPGDVVFKIPAPVVEKLQTATPVVTAPKPTTPAAPGI